MGKRGKRTAFGEKLRDHTGQVWGVQTPCGLTRMRNETWAGLYNRLPGVFGTMRVPFRLVNGHEAGISRLKVCARHGGVSLLYFDIDTHDGQGSTADARIMAEVVRQHFPHMPEFVVTDRGASGWLRVDTGGVSPEEYNRLVARLQTHLQSVQAAMGLDLTEVAVKGRVYQPTVVKGVCTAVKSGDLLKAPPTIDWLEQPIVEAEVLREGRFDPWQPLEQLAVVKPVAKRAATGSFVGRLLSEEQIGNIGEVEKIVALHFGDRPTRAGKLLISNRDFAELLVTMTVLPPNKDGSNPYERHQKFHEAVYKEGDFKRAWRFEVYKVVRDYLSEKGAVAWVDERYKPAPKKAGQAMRWSLDEGLVGLVKDSLNNNNQYTMALITPLVLENTHRTPRCMLGVTFASLCYPLFEEQWPPTALLALAA